MKVGEAGAKGVVFEAYRLRREGAEWRKNNEENRVLKGFNGRTEG